MNLLMVEDDIELCNATKQSLEREGYRITVCHDGNDAISFLSEYTYDLMILDRMLPGKDGLKVIQFIRHKNNHMPVIMVTAMSGINDRIDGLDSGADDYLTKPFDINELKARIRALLRRPQSFEISTSLDYGDITLDPHNLTLTCHGQSINILKKEAYLFEFLIRNKAQAVTREQILLRIWGEEADVTEGNIDTYIYFIRRHLKALNSKVTIKAVHGLGYRLIT